MKLDKLIKELEKIRNDKGGNSKVIIHDGLPGFDRDLNLSNIEILEDCVVLNATTKANRFKKIQKVKFDETCKVNFLELLKIKNSMDQCLTLNRAIPTFLKGCWVNLSIPFLSFEEICFAFSEYEKVFVSKTLRYLMNNYIIGWNTKYKKYTIGYI